jgi:hypothetical protein
VTTSPGDRDAAIIRGLAEDGWTPEKITEQHGYPPEVGSAVLGPFVDDLDRPVTRSV